ncbi:MAG: formylglycine-generating enzyme family protein [Kiritimatiellae bacterium]|nr:formylglycine-generating enzyme family protein [Kiritimatiellia bacterium]
MKSKNAKTKVGTGGKIGWAGWGRALCLAVAVLAAGALAGCAKGPQTPAEVWNRLGPGKKAGQTKKIKLPGGAKMEMVWCPPGTFLMGSPETEEGRLGTELLHPVTLTEGFWMAKTEVTQKQWKSVMGTTIRQQRKKVNKLLGKDWKENGSGSKYPICFVSWDECQEFCRKSGLSLPTEAEWEYACRAGSTGAFSGTGKLDSMGWHHPKKNKKDGGSHPVAKKKPNAWGLYDMHGNVSEWCEDWFEDYPAVAVTDPTGPAWGQFRAIRGGSGYAWPKSDNSGACRSASRDTANPGYAHQSTGFRPVARAAK